jgi:predicted histone-like DNA-binding protein
MPITFNVVQRGNPAKPDVPKKYYPSIQSNGRMSLRELAELAADRSTLSTVDIMAAVESFLHIIPEALADGKVVELGDFGNFWLRFTSEGVEHAEDVRGDHIRSLIPRFMPGKRFKDALAAAKFKKLP